MSEGSITQKLNTEGADLLTLAGVNDGNLIELSRIGGVKVALRGDTLSITGPLDFVERAANIARRMLDAARQRLELTADDVLRLSDEIDRRRGGDARDNGDYDEDFGGDANGGVAVDAQRIALPGIRRVIQAKTPGQAEYLRKMQENDIVVGIGPAGTGKTYLAVAAAVDALTRKRVRRIVLARPAVEAGESLGFLPGDMQAKVDPYLRPLYDALDEMMPFERIQRALETRTIGRISKRLVPFLVLCYFVAYLDRVYDPIDSLTALTKSLQEHTVSLRRALRLTAQSDVEPRGRALAA